MKWYLACLKESIAKIENHYKRKGKPDPLGYRIGIPTGELAGVNQPLHFSASGAEI
jgi:hypothetical protein